MRRKKRAVPNNPEPRSIKEEGSGVGSGSLNMPLKELAELKPAGCEIVMIWVIEKVCPGIAVIEPAPLKGFVENVRSAT